MSKQTENNTILQFAYEKEFVSDSTTLVKTVFSQTKPPTTTLPGCGDVGDTTLKRSIDLTVGVLIATLNIIEIIIIAKIKREKNI